MYENSMSPADVAAVMGNNNNGYNDGYGFGGGAWWWIIILFLFGMNGGWGRGGFGGGYGSGDGVGSEVQRGFDQNAVMSGINGLNGAVTAGFGNVQTALCNGFAGVNAGVANGFAQAEIAENGRQMANMNQMFGIQSALQQCCCDNRAATADLKYTVANEACADRAAVEEYWNLSRVLSADIWKGCCESVTIRNLSDIPILVQNASVDITRPDLNITR